MKKNVAGQVIAWHLTSKADGSSVTTGTTTVYVTGDNGTQRVADDGTSPTVGLATHKGNGLWTFTPAQSETNFTHVAFTFVNSTAIIGGPQFYPSFPQTGDAYLQAGINTLALSNMASSTLPDIANRLPAALVSGRMDSSVGAMASGVLTATAIASDAITAAKVADGTIDAATFAAGAIDAAAIATDALGALELAAGAASEIATAVRTELTTELGRIDVATSTRLASASYTAPLDAAGTRSAVGLASANLDTQLGAIDDYVDTEVSAIKAVTDKIDQTLEIDASGPYRFTADALSRAPTGSGGSTLTAADIRAAIGMASANLDTQLDALPTTAEVNAEVDTALSDVGLTTTITGRIDVAVSTRLASASYTAPDNSTITAIAGYVDTEVAAIKAKTDQLTFTTANRVDSQVFGMQSGTVTATAIATDAIDADALASDAVTEIQSGLSSLDAAGVRSAVGLASANLDTQLSAIDAVTDKVDGMLTADASGPYRWTGDALSQWQTAYIEGTRTWQASARGWNAALLGKASGMSTTTATIRDIDDSKDRIVATVDSYGDRTAITLDLT